MVNYIDGNSLTKVRLEAVHPAVQDGTQLIGIPLHRIRIGKVHQSHAGLPVIGLPYAPAVGAHEKVAFFGSFLKETGSLGDIGIDPHTDL